MFNSAWLVLCVCGVWHWNQAEALVLVEQEVERAEHGVLVGGKTVAGVEVAGAETVEWTLSMISATSKPTKWFRSAVSSRICPHW